MARVSDDGFPFVGEGDGRLGIAEIGRLVAAMGGHLEQTHDVQQTALAAYGRMGVADARRLGGSVCGRVRGWLLGGLPRADAGGGQLRPHELVGLLL